MPVTRVVPSMETLQEEKGYRKFHLFFSKLVQDPDGGRIAHSVRRYYGLGTKNYF